MISSWLTCPPTGVGVIETKSTSATKSPEIRDRVLNDGADPVGNTPEQFAAYIRSEYDKYGQVIKATGARAD